MQMNRVVGLSSVVVLVVGLAGVGSAVAAHGTSSGAHASQARAASRAAAPVASASRMQVHATLNQLMQGIMFPNSNVIFAAQRDDPGAIKRDADPSMSVNPLTGAYGGWQAVENSGMALTAAANLLMLPGRVCSNGKPVPVGAADWPTFVQGLRDAGLATVKAAKAKSQDQILDVSDQLTTACANCHEVYRDKDNPAARCTK